MSVESERDEGLDGLGDGGWAVRYLGEGNESLARQSLCRVDYADIPPGRVYVENEGGQIVFRAV
jgi:hypothetical protein